MANKKNIDSIDERLEEIFERKETNDAESDEFRQGENKTEDIDIPALRNSIKTERIEKEDIYGSKKQNQEAFIASLVRNNGMNIEGENTGLEYDEDGMSGRKKAFFAIVILFIIGSLAGFGYWLWSKKKYETALKEAESRSIAQLYKESVQSEASEQEAEEKSEPVEKIAPMEVSIRVLNEGAAAGSAGKIKDLLAEKGYSKATADNGELDSAGTFIYYNEEKFKLSAEAIKGILSENKIESSVKEALTSQQKSADIVVILGK